MANRLLGALADAVRKSFTGTVPSISYNPNQETGLLLDPYPPSRTITGGADYTSPITGNLPSTRLNYQRLAGNPYDNTLVAAVLQWICRNFPLSRLVIRTGGEGDEEIADDHPLVTLVKRPNAFYSGTDLWAATLRSYNMDGNAYWYKVRNGYKRVTELWYLPHWLVTPVGTKDGSVFIDHYDYKVGTETMHYPVTDIVHFRNGVDPFNPRMGVSLVKALLREIFTDNESSQYTASMVMNGGIMNVVVSPDLSQIETAPTPAQMEEMKRRYMQKFGGDNRGEPFFSSGPLKVQTVSYPPSNMDLATIRRVPEERVAAMLGVPPGVVGFGAGLQRNTFTNYDTALRAAYENNILPTQMAFAEKLTAQLLSEPQFAAAVDAECGFETSHIKVLQDDENKIYERLQGWWDAGLLKRSEPRKAMGWPVDETDEVYKTDLISNFRETVTVASPTPVTNDEMEQAAEADDTDDGTNPLTGDDAGASE